MFDRPIWYLLDAQGNPYPTNDTHAANELLAHVERRRVGLVEKEVAGHKILVSTVFLVMDHSHFAGLPVLYETMLFIDDEEVDSATQRYHTRGEAEEGHEAIANGVEQVLMSLGQQNLDTTHIIALIGESH